MLIGAHVPSEDPLAAAEARGAEAVQVFLSPPRSWKRPPPRDDAATLRVAAMPVYVHAPYLINVATTNNRVRHPSRQNLQQTLEAADDIAAAGVVVHGGHVTGGGDPEEGLDNWRKALARAEADTPILIENTAGGDHAMARTVDQIGRLWEIVEDSGTPVGFCLDTCHLWAAGEDLLGATRRLREIVGGIDLLHLNDSRDAPGSGRDRHANLGAGQIDPGVLVEVVREADAPVVIVETPGGAEDQGADIAWIRDRL